MQRQMFQIIQVIYHKVILIGQLMTIERADPDFRIPYNEEAIRSGDPMQLAEDMLELVIQARRRPNFM